MNTTAPVARFIAIFMAALAVTGCSASADSDERSEPEIGTPTAVTSSRQIQLPLARYLAPASDEQAYFAAVNVAQRDCAKAFGVTSRIPVAKQPALIELASERRYGIVNADEVERYGYQLLGGQGAEGDSKAGGWDPDQRELLVMNAVSPDGGNVSTDPETGQKLPEGGCSAEGFRRIDSGDLPPPVNTLAEDLLAQAWERTKADSRALKAEQDWSDCMSELGYDFAHRWDAGNSVGSEALDVQLQMAKRDLKCAVDSNYVGVWYAVDTAYQDRLIGAHEADLEATLAEHSAVMGRVVSTLEGGS